MKETRGTRGGEAASDGQRLVGAALLIVGALSFAAPRATRAELRREWTGELVAWWRERAQRGETGIGWRLRLLARAVLVLGDAWTMRRLERGGVGTVAVERRRREISMRDLLSDLAIALRSLRRRPALATICVLTLALGIGATAVVTSLAWGLVLEPLDYPQPEKLVDVWPERWWSKELFERIRAEATSFEKVALWSASAHRLVGDDGGTILQGPVASAAFLEVLGRSVSAGRGLEPQDERPGADVALLTDEGLRRRFASSPHAALGRLLDLDGRRVEVIGVLPAGLDVLQRDAELVRPSELDPEGSDWDANYLHVVARLRDGVTVEAATAELGDLARRWGADRGWSEETIAEAGVVPLHDSLARSARPSMLLLLGAVLCVLLLAAANVANLLLARALEREREMRVRAVLGARPGRLLRQAWTESAVLALAGGALGTGVAVLGLPAVVDLLPQETPRLEHVALDGWSLVVAVVTTVGIALLVGLAPALHALRANLRPVAASVAGGGAALRARSALVVCEVTLAVLLTVAAGLLAKSFLRTMRTDLGVKTGGLLTFLHVPEADRFETPRELAAYYDGLRQSLAALPGVEGVAEAHALPIQNSGWTMEIYPQDRPPAVGEPRAWASWRPVSEGYFGLLGVPLLRGRGFTGVDTLGAPAIGILNRTGASRLFPDGDALGQRVEMPWDTGEPIEIVGVVEDARLKGARADVPTTLYRPYEQAVAKTHAQNLAWRSIVLRAAGEPRGLERQVRELVLSFDPRAAVDRVTTMDEVVAEDRAGPRLLLVLVGLFAGTGVLLGAVGIYGVLECLVRDRLRELAIRAALGASRRAVRGLVLRRSATIAGAGALLGGGLALLAGRLLESSLHQVSARDPYVFAAALAGAVAVALLAAWWPARRAGAADPGGLLRGE
ncbi:MAG TPA: ADOP family duplicated permease [Thermoanaerobaculia bacterium]|nr:ADOP family duplicated permease [Thermoanaerobaculia bacterium]